MSRCDVLTTGTKAAVRNLLGTKRSEDRYGWTSPRRFATVIASVRLRTFSFVKMLRKCPFTVVSLLAGLFALCGAAAPREAGRRQRSCWLPIDKLTCSPAQSSETAIRRG